MVLFIDKVVQSSINIVSVVVIVRGLIPADHSSIVLLILHVVVRHFIALSSIVQENGIRDWALALALQWR